MTTPKLVIPHTATKSLVLNENELSLPHIAGISFNLYDLISHYHSINALMDASCMLPSAAKRFIDASSGYDKIRDNKVMFRSSIDGRKLSISLDELKQLDELADGVFFPNELGTERQHNKLQLVHVDDLDKLNTIGSEGHHHQLYVKGIKSKQQWQAMLNQPVDLIESDYPFRFAYEKQATLGDSILDLGNALFEKQFKSIDAACSCYTCAHFTRAYLHHLLEQTPLLAIKLVAIHNLADMIYPC